MHYKIFIIEDDPIIAELISTNAQKWGFDVYIVQDFKNILDEFTQYDPHLVLMDLILPFHNGLYWCNEIRKLSTVPIIFISSVDDDMNQVTSMNLGADDYLVKPFDQNVLIAKIQALLRRTYSYSESNPVIECRSVYLKPFENKLIFNDKEIDLTKNETHILSCLMERNNEIVSREFLIEKLWKSNQFIDDNTLTVNINRLRKKLKSIGLTDFIITRHGSGYIIYNNL